MYRWYENAQVCYAYLHDVLDLSFPVARHNERYATGWLEWFAWVHTAGDDSAK